MTALQSFYGLYKAMDKGVDENLMEIFEYLEHIQPLISKWVSSGFLDMAMYVSDDTTSGRALALQTEARKLGTLIDGLLETYLGISDEEAAQIHTGVRAVCENLAVIHFSTDRYSEYVESIQKNTFNLESIEMTRYVTDIAAQGMSLLIEDIRTTLEILIRFEVYLPEYTLTEEELDTIAAYLEESGRGSYEIGVLDRDTVRRKLDEN